MCVIIHEMIYDVHPFGYSVKRMELFKKEDVSLRHDRLRRLLRGFDVGRGNGVSGG
jgi:hypothetical protein